MAEKGDEAKLVAMIEAKVVNINAVDVSSLRSALHLAAMGGHLPCLKVLLDNGLDVVANSTDKVCVASVSKVMW